jgi:hypothetical protein
VDRSTGLDCCGNARKDHVKPFVLFAFLLAVTTSVRAEDVPLPEARPADAGANSNGHVPDPPAPGNGAHPSHDDPPEPQISACRARLTADIAIVQSLAPLVGPGECGAPDVVRLEAIVLPDGARVAMSPVPTMRCTMAEAVAHWVREDVAPLSADLGSVLKTIESFDSYDCRGRNRVVGAKLSEHGKANALDVRALKLASGKVADLTDAAVSSSVRESLRKSACTRFTTVLGPGSDGYHENHIHVDLAERHNNYRICQWDIRLPPGAEAAQAANTPPASAPPPMASSTTLAPVSPSAKEAATVAKETAAAAREAAPAAKEAAPVAKGAAAAPKDAAREPSRPAVAADALEAAKASFEPVPVDPPEPPAPTRDASLSPRLAQAAANAFGVAKASFDVPAPPSQECGTRHRGRRNGCAQQSRRSRHRNARSSVYQPGGVP